MPNRPVTTIPTAPYAFYVYAMGKVRLSFANGAALHKQFSTLLGGAKIVRYLEFSTLRDIDDLFVKRLIDESLLLNMEKDALNDLRKEFKQQR
ncbi:MAG: hypothetical protein PF439_10960 [Helicobacteraceae bacterium]|jgi:hypothetical protein|nr:hypothetical protein [Helicobacteraceae bacterium]